MRFIFRKILFLLLSVCVVSRVQGQRTFNEILWAIDKAEAGNQWEKAIELYHRAIAADTISADYFSWYLRLGLAYQELKNKQKTKEFFALAIKAGNCDIVGWKSFIVCDLTALYLEEKKTDSALYYLNYVNSQPNFVHGRFDSSVINRRKWINHRSMLLYEELEKIDSAIWAFSPCAFREWKEKLADGTKVNSIQHVDTGDYHCQVQDFIRVLLKKYPLYIVREELMKSVEELYVTKIKVNATVPLYKVNGRFTFFEQGIDLPPQHLSGEENTPEHLSKLKQQYINDLKNSLLYRLLVTAPEL